MDGDAIQPLPTADDDDLRQARALRNALLGRAHQGSTRVCSAAADAWTAVAQQKTLTHLPRRPRWTCRSCHRAWPCPVARESLYRELAAGSLAVYMSAQMCEAIRDLPKAKPGALWHRFLAWTRRPTPDDDARVHAPGARPSGWAEGRAVSTVTPATLAVRS